jgi:hypothetical protein
MEEPDFSLRFHFAADEVCHDFIPLEEGDFLNGAKREPVLNVLGDTSRRLLTSVRDPSPQPLKPTSHWINLPFGPSVRNGWMADVPERGKLGIVVSCSPFSRQPYRRRTWLRQRLPFWVLDLGVAGKGHDCEAAGGRHEWYNQGGHRSGCYHCRASASGRLWLYGDADVLLKPPTHQS